MNVNNGRNETLNQGVHLTAELDVPESALGINSFQKWTRSPYISFSIAVISDFK